MNERPKDDVFLGKTHVRVLVSGEQTSKRYAITESTYGPGVGLGLHRHLNFSETNIVIEGSLQGVVDGKRFSSGRGDVLRIPKGVLHTVENASVEESVVFASIYEPSGMDEYFQKLAKGLEAGQLAHGGREALQKEYGVVFEGPFFTQRKKTHG
jgi:mannose-6-phosphate isomerase-like protein (cupin superfamily)